MIRAIAFDWGGIFTEGTFDSGAVRALARLYGVPEEQIAEHYYPLMAEFEVGAFGLDEFIARFAARSGLETDPQRFREAFLGTICKRRWMTSLLASIPGIYVVGMLSNNVPVLCDAIRHDARMSRIEEFVFSNEIRVRKPDPAAFAALSKVLGVPPQETVFIDDSKANIAACRALGFHGIWYDSDEGFKRQWQALLPDIPLPDAENPKP